MLIISRVKLNGRLLKIQYQALASGTRTTYHHGFVLRPFAFTQDGIPVIYVTFQYSDFTTTTNSFLAGVINGNALIQEHI